MNKKKQFRKINGIFSDSVIEIPKTVPGKTDKEKNKYISDRLNCLYVYETLYITNLAKYVYPTQKISSQPTKKEIEFSKNIIQKLQIKTDNNLIDRDGIKDMWRDFLFLQMVFYQDIKFTSTLNALLKLGVLDDKYKVRKKEWDAILNVIDGGWYKYRTHSEYTDAFSSAYWMKRDCKHYKKDIPYAEVEKAVFHFIKKEPWYKDYKTFVAKTKPVFYREIESVVTEQKKQVYSSMDFKFILKNVAYEHNEKYIEKLAMLKTVFAFHKMDFLIDDEIVRYEYGSKFLESMFNHIFYVLRNGKINFLFMASGYNKLESKENFWLSVASCLFLLHEENKIPKSEKSVQKELRSLKIINYKNRIRLTNFERALRSICDDWRLFHNPENINYPLLKKYISYRGKRKFNMDNLGLLQNEDVNKKLRAFYRKNSKTIHGLLH